jgi:hypothetical protein
MDIIDSLDRRTRIGLREDKERKHVSEEETSLKSWKDTAIKYVPTMLLIGTLAYMMLQKNNKT